MMMVMMVSIFETVWAWHVIWGRVRDDDGVDCDEYEGNNFENGNCLDLARYMGTCQRQT